MSRAENNFLPLKCERLTSQRHIARFDIMTECGMFQHMSWSVRPQSLIYVTPGSMAKRVPLTARSRRSSLVHHRESRPDGPNRMRLHAANGQLTTIEHHGRRTGRGARAHVRQTVRKDGVDCVGRGDEVLGDLLKNCHLLPLAAILRRKTGTVVVGSRQSATADLR